MTPDSPGKQPFYTQRGHAPLEGFKESQTRLVVPAIKREKLMIEKIGLAGLLALWLAATGVSFVVTVICGIVLFDNLGIGILCGTILAGIVAVRAVFRIRGSIRQWQQRRGRVKS